MGLKIWIKEMVWFGYTTKRGRQVLQAPALLSSVPGSNSLLFKENPFRKQKPRSGLEWGFLDLYQPLSPLGWAANSK